MMPFIWKMGLTSYNKSILTFCVGALRLPLAFGRSKGLRIQWKI